uniref:Uncharacterized protein n=1 Tax=Anguilla anguilla TaxID=7936 RepID=A0A0E9WNG8_ANGAN
MILSMVLMVGSLPKPRLFSKFYEYFGSFCPRSVILQLMLKTMDVFVFKGALLPCLWSVA